LGQPLAAEIAGSDQRNDGALPGQAVGQAAGDGDRRGGSAAADRR
jgi:hypothetical protein